MEITSQLTELLEREEVLWRQRSHVQWLAAGDKNTCFFHLCVSQWRKKNRITESVKEDGSLELGEEELDHMARRFYRDMYTLEGVQGVDEVMRAVPV
jgi:hypothetical protein